MTWPRVNAYIFNYGIIYSNLNAVTSRQQTLRCRFEIVCDRFTYRYGARRLRQHCDTSNRREVSSRLHFLVL